MPYLEELAAGRPGTLRTLQVMRDLVEQGKRDPALVSLARRVVAHVRERDTPGEINALADFVRRRLRFVHDPVHVETLSDPRSILRNGAGDCDDHVVLLSTLAECVGYRTRAKVTGSDPDRYAHVYLEVQDWRTGQWLPIDPSAPHPVGWEPPGAARETFSGLGCPGGCACMACRRQRAVVTKGSLVNPALGLAPRVFAEQPVSTSGTLFGSEADWQLPGMGSWLSKFRKKVKKAAGRLPGAQLVRKLPGGSQFIGKKSKKKKKKKGQTQTAAYPQDMATMPQGGPPILKPEPGDMTAAYPGAVPTAYDGAYSTKYDLPPAYQPAQFYAPGVPQMVLPAAASVMYQPAPSWGGGGGGGGSFVAPVEHTPWGYEPDVGPGPSYEFEAPEPEYGPEDQTPYPMESDYEESAGTEGLFGLGAGGVPNWVIPALLALAIIKPRFLFGRR